MRGRCLAIKFHARSLLVLGIDPARVAVLTQSSHFFLSISTIRFHDRAAETKPSGHSWFHGRGGLLLKDMLATVPGS